MAGFTKQQIQSLDALFNKHLDILFDRIQDDFRRQRSSAPLSAPPPAPLPAPQACASTPPELPPHLPPQLPPLPPTNPPHVKILQEVEHIWKHRASKAVPTIRVAKSSENCIGWPPKFGGIDMCFSRDEEPDAWYTTMLNHRQKLIEALPNTA